MCLKSATFLFKSWTDAEVQPWQGWMCQQLHRNTSSLPHQLNSVSKDNMVPSDHGGWSLAHSRQPFTPMGSLKSSINPTPPNACVWRTLDYSERRHANMGRTPMQNRPGGGFQLRTSGPTMHPPTGAGPDAAQWIMC